MSLLKYKLTNNNKQEINTMTNKQKTSLWAIAFCLGLLTDQVYSNVLGKTAELMTTKSGIFVVQENHLYELVELEPALKPNNRDFK